MAAIVTGYLTANGTIPVAPPQGTQTSFPGTFAAFGTFGGGTIAVSAGFRDINGVLQYIPITGASFTAAGTVNIAVRCDALQLALTGATSPNLGYWIG